MGYEKIVQELAREWQMGTTSVMTSQNTVAKKIISSFSCGTGSKTTTIGDTLELTLNSAKKYLNEFCNIFKEGEYTVISHKKGGTVDVSKIGELNRDGTIIRYNTAKQAEEEAKKILMKQFELPSEQQREVSLITRNRDLYLNTIGEAHISKLPSVSYDSSVPKRELKIFHNHPTNTADGNSYPLSIGDIITLANANVHSITALNKFGEYSTVTLKEPLTDGVPQYILTTFKNRLEPILGENVMPGNNPPQLYSSELHKAYKELLPQFDMKYTTNYFNLANL